MVLVVQIGNAEVYRTCIIVSGPGAFWMNTSRDRLESLKTGRNMKPG